jgi:hypothetical protein
MTTEEHSIRARIIQDSERQMGRWVAIGGFGLFSLLFMLQGIAG